MPNYKEDFDGFPHRGDCYANRHLQGNLFKCYNVMYAIAYFHRKRERGNGADGPLIFTAAITPTLCNAVLLHRNQVGKLIKKLELAGWIRLVKRGGIDPQTNRRLPDHYQVIEHDEFVEANPGTCPADIYDKHGRKAGRRQSIPKNFDVAHRNGQGHIAHGSGQGGPCPRKEQAPVHGSVESLPTERGGPCPSNEEILAHGSGQDLKKASKKRMKEKHTTTPTSSADAGVAENLFSSHTLGLTPQTPTPVPAAAASTIVARETATASCASAQHSETASKSKSSEKAQSAKSAKRKTDLEIWREFQAAFRGVGLIGPPGLDLTYNKKHVAEACRLYREHAGWPVIYAFQIWLLGEDQMKRLGVHNPADPDNLQPRAWLLHDFVRADVLDTIEDAKKEKLALASLVPLPFPLIQFELSEDCENLSTDNWLRLQEISQHTKWGKTGLRDFFNAYRQRQFDNSVDSNEALQLFLTSPLEGEDGILDHARRWEAMKERKWHEARQKGKAVAQ